jgi:hypothetical protein
VAVSYVLHKADADDRWSIAVTVIHDTDRVMRPDLAATDPPSSSPDTIDHSEWSML